MVMSIAIMILILGGDSVTVNAFVIPSTTTPTTPTTGATFLSVALSPEEQALQRTKKQLEKLQQKQRPTTVTAKNVIPTQQQSNASYTTTTTTTTGTAIKRNDNTNDDDRDELNAQIQSYLLLPANALKSQLKSKGLPTKGRKPDLARRLADYDYQLEHGRTPSYYFDEDDHNSNDSLLVPGKKSPSSNRDASSSSSSYNASSDSSSLFVKRFCGMRLSPNAGKALGNANFVNPTPIQAKTIPLLNQGESVILHEETGSGKTVRRMQNMHYYCKNAMH
jgi:superfamily II RNA helicase